MNKNVNGAELLANYNHPDASVVVKFQDADIMVKYALSFDEVLSFVSATVDSCFTTDGGYVPQAKKFAFMANIIDYYTDVQMPDNLNDRYALAVLSGLYDVVVNEIDDRQLDSLHDSVERLIDNILTNNANIARNELSKAVASLNSIVQIFNQTANDMSPATMQNVIDALNDNTADRQQLIAAYQAALTLNKESNKEGIDTGE